MVAIGTCVGCRVSKPAGRAVRAGVVPTLQPISSPGSASAIYRAVRSQYPFRQEGGMPKRIIVVDDEPSIVKILTKRLMGWGYVVLSASSATELLAKLSVFKPDVILLDLSLIHI